MNGLLLLVPSILLSANALISSNQIPVVNGPLTAVANSNEISSSGICQALQLSAKQSESMVYLNLFAIIEPGMDMPLIGPAETVHQYILAVSLDFQRPAVGIIEHRNRHMIGHRNFKTTTSIRIGG